MDRPTVAVPPLASRRSNRLDCLGSRKHFQPALRILVFASKQDLDAAGLPARAGVALLCPWFPDFVADVFTAIARETLDGRNAYVTDGVSRALGRNPRDFVDFARVAVAQNLWATAA